MDINFLRSAVTLLSLLAFLGICVWAYSRRAAPGFSSAERLPFADSKSPEPHHE